MFVKTFLSQEEQKEVMAQGEYCCKLQKSAAYIIDHQMFAGIFLSQREQKAQEGGEMRERPMLPAQAGRIRRG